jgi:hypothetical protein
VGWRMTADRAASRKYAERIRAKFTESADSTIQLLAFASGRKPLQHVDPEIAWDVTEKNTTGHDYLKQRLKSAAERFLSNKRLRTLRSPSTRVQDMRSVRLAVDRVLMIYNREVVLGDVSANQHDFLRSLYGGAFVAKKMRECGRHVDHANEAIYWPDDYGERSSLINKAIQGLSFLRDAAIHEEWSQRSRMRTVKSERGRRDIAIDKLIRDLADIWTDCFGGRHALSRHAATRPKSGQPTGPFFRFTSEIFRLLEVHISDEALATRISRVLHAQVSNGNP